MVPSDTDTKQLTKNSKLVATVTGTAAWEAIQMGIPAVTFGNSWFNSLPGVTTFDSSLDLSKVSLQEIDLEKLSYSVGALFEKCHNGNIDKGYFDGAKAFNHEQNAREIGRLLNGLLTRNIPFTFSS